MLSNIEPRGNLCPLRPRVSIIIPVYNNEGNLTNLVDRLAAVLASTFSQYELILVNDGSIDNSWNTINRLVGEHKWVRGLNLMRNYGQHNALLCGLRAAKFELVVTMDDDLQNPPEEIPHLLEKLSSGFDVVYGTPQVEQHGLWRDLASRLLKWGLKISMNSDIAGRVSAFRIFRTQMRDAFRHYNSPYVSIDVLLTWATSRFSWVPVQHHARSIGRSNYNLRRLLAHAMHMITGFSVMPLRFASFVGFFMTVFGLGILIYVIARYVALGGSIPGFPFLASVIAIFSGTQMFALGIMGEYLARIYNRTMDRPPYIVRESTDDLSIPELTAHSLRQ